jgi:hypothetical protein
MDEGGMMPHTPAPWVIYDPFEDVIDDPFEDGIPVEVIAADATICTVEPLSVEWTPEEIANARLICAAPDLLAALKMLLPEGWDDGSMDHMQGVREARRAIAKAIEGV